MTGTNQKLGQLYNEDMKGFSSFEVDTDSCFDEEFDSESVTLDYFKERFDQDLPAFVCDPAIRK